MITVEVDRTKCMGAGNCAFHAPETFDLDEELRVVVIGAGTDADALRRAAEGCPTGAIALRQRQ